MRWALAVLLIVAIGVGVVLLSPAPLRNQALCAAGVARSCFNLAVMLEEGKAVPQDKVRAVQHFQQACDGGVAAGCLSLGVIHDEGKGVAKDPAKAARLFQKACEGGAAMGCFRLASMHDEGAVVAKDLAKAAQLYQKACDGGVANGCFNLGVMRQEGTGVAQDKTKAAAFYRKACDMEYEDACYNLALCYDKGEGVQQDKARAGDLLKVWCDKRHVESCVGLARREPKLAAALERSKIMIDQCVAENSRAVEAVAKMDWRTGRPSGDQLLALERMQKVQAIGALPQIVMAVRRGEILLRLAKTTTPEASASRAEALRRLEELRTQDEDTLLSTVNIEWRHDEPSSKQRAAAERYHDTLESLKGLLEEAAKGVK